MKKTVYVVGLLSLGFVIFNNVVQTAQIIKSNTNLINGLVIALIGSISYGLVNLK